MAAINDQSMINASMTECVSNDNNKKMTCSIDQPPNSPYDVSEAMKKAIPLVREFIKEARKLKNIEIELRFGSISQRDKRFVPGISRSNTDKFINTLQTNKHMSTFSTDWNECCDYFFPIRSFDKQMLARTRVTYDTNDLVTKKTHCIKNKVKEIVFVFGHPDHLAMKLCLNIEKPIDQSDIPAVTNTEYVRMQQRRSFSYGGNRQDQNWKFDFSMTWAGRTRTQAEQSQVREEPQFEFEIELTGDNYFQQHDDEYLATSLLLKGLDFTDGHSELEVFSTNMN
jgi:hypothetical protein